MQSKILDKEDRSAIIYFLAVLYIFSLVHTSIGYNMIGVVWEDAVNEQLDVLNIQLSKAVPTYRKNYENTQDFVETVAKASLITTSSGVNSYNYFHYKSPGEKLFLSNVQKGMLVDQVSIREKSISFDKSNIT